MEVRNNAMLRTFYRIRLDFVIVTKHGPNFNLHSSMNCKLIYKSITIFFILFNQFKNIACQNITSGQINDILIVFLLFTITEKQ